ncbi:hypothetical protein [Pontiella sulfatireligans]|uniref:Uncharacterized protein n=1 Tax=Pontiella sulfatireligans TaxID=2750658 RepID=A0A6C2UFY3_9BACT|nr:hypothetical protein [Pontiella sulfatireligans]VGO18783.1 hypothetical protein SCARR_00836 [Pontiella sulfatireligans]
MSNNRKSDDIKLTEEQERTYSDFIRAVDSSLSRHYAPLYNLAHQAYRIETMLSTSAKKELITIIKKGYPAKKIHHFILSEISKQSEEKASHLREINDKFAFWEDLKKMEPQEAVMWEPPPIWIRSSDSQQGDKLTNYCTSPVPQGRIWHACQSCPTRR